MLTCDCFANVLEEVWCLREETETETTVPQKEEGKKRDHRLLLLHCGAYLFFDAINVLHGEIDDGRPLIDTDFVRKKDDDDGFPTSPTLQSQLDKPKSMRKPQSFTTPRMDQESLSIALHTIRSLLPSKKEELVAIFQKLHSPQQRVLKTQVFDAVDRAHGSTFLKEQEEARASSQDFKSFFVFS